jgi:hypothetical protein
MYAAAGRTDRDQGSLRLRRDTDAETPVMCLANRSIQSALKTTDRALRVCETGRTPSPSVVRSFGKGLWRSLFAAWPSTPACQGRPASCTSSRSWNLPRTNTPESWARVTGRRAPRSACAHRPAVTTCSWVSTTTEPAGPRYHRRAGCQDHPANLDQRDGGQLRAGRTAPSRQRCPAGLPDALSGCGACLSRTTRPAHRSSALPAPAGARRGAGP